MYLSDIEYIKAIDVYVNMVYNWPLKRMYICLTTQDLFNLEVN